MVSAVGDANNICVRKIPMRKLMLRFALSTFCLAVTAGGDTGTVTLKRTVPCRTPANTASCYWTHGRLHSYNGTPAFRLWKIGTHRLLGIYSGPSVDRTGLDNENPEFPENVERAFQPPQNIIFGDFEVCPLEPERQGVMQAACVEAAKNLVVEK